MSLVSVLLLLGVGALIVYLLWTLIFPERLLMNLEPGLGDTASGLLTVAALLAILALAYVPLGDYLTAVLTPTRHIRVERGLYRLLGVNPDGQQNARSYALAVLAFSLVSILVLVAILMGQAYLPFSRGLAGMGPTMAINTAVSFVTNTNWQSYAGESTLGYTAQAAGLTVQNFASAAVGIAVAAALLRGFAARDSSELGNFWVDLIRIVLRLLLPLSIVVAVLLLACGVIQNLAPDRVITTIAGGSQTLPGGPVASQEAIKLLGTNGGGFFNANSAHPYENPNPVTNLIEIAAPADHPGLSHPDRRHHARQPPAGHRPAGRDGRALGRGAGRRPPGRRSPPGARCPRPPVRRWRARRPSSGSGPAPCSRPAPPAPPPGR